MALPIVKTTFATITAAAAEYHRLGPLPPGYVVHTLSAQVNFGGTGRLDLSPVYTASAEQSAANHGSGSDVVSQSDSTLNGRNLVSVTGITGSQANINLPIERYIDSGAVFILTALNNAAAITVNIILTVVAIPAGQTGQGFALGEPPTPEDQLGPIPLIGEDIMVSPGGKGGP